MDWQNRITGLEHHTASELMDHAGNWRTHPKHQADALAGVLSEVGIVDALLVYHSERQGGLTVIDGHLRKELDKQASWPCLMTDLSDDEADLVLASFDWLTYQAQADRESLQALLDNVSTSDQSIQRLLSQMSNEFLTCHSGTIENDLDELDMGDIETDEIFVITIKGPLHIESEVMKTISQINGIDITTNRIQKF